LFFVVILSEAKDPCIGLCFAVVSVVALAFVVAFAFFVVIPEGNLLPSTEPKTFASPPRQGQRPDTKPP
jgi:hypothetical protein